MTVEARHIRVRGLVQGVWFRHFTKVRARELGLTGWVRNCADGSVEVWAEGESKALAGLLEWLAVGPAEARVDQVECRSVPRVTDRDPVDAEAGPTVVPGRFVVWRSDS